MQNQFEYITKNGLKVIYVYKPKFVKSYAGIGVEFGGGNTSYHLKGEKKVVPEGAAHFIEHKLFSMPDGTDAFQLFNKMNASANAYTSVDKTIYYFSTTDDVTNPLKLLLDMYFTPHFNKEEVQREKDIIISEIKMYEDQVYSRFQRKVLENLYPADPYATSIAGTVESVTSITEADLLEIYNAFYTPKRSVLVIVSNKKKEEIFHLVEEKMSAFEFNNLDIQPEKMVLSSTPAKDFVLKDQVLQSQAFLAVRLDANYTYPLFANHMIGILDCILSPMSSFYQELAKEKLFIGDMDYTAMTSKDTAYVTIYAISKHPKKLLERLESKLQSLTIEDLNQEILDLYLRHLKAKSIGQLDSIDYLGDEVLNLALEHISYLNELELIKNLTVDDFGKYIPCLAKGKALKAICENK